jgi:hypothetical protein
MPANMSKLFYHWGLEDIISKMGKKSTSVDLQRCTYLHSSHSEFTADLLYQTVESGEWMGTHIWEEEMIQETGGDFIFAHVLSSLSLSDIHCLLIISTLISESTSLNMLSKGGPSSGQTAMSLT